MSGRIETFDSRKEQTSKWSQNEAFSVREAGVDIGKSGGQGGGSNVSVDQVVTSGREVAGVTVDGDRTPIYIPNSGEWTQSDWAETNPADDAYIKNKPSLAEVATSGSYEDLSDKPDLSIYISDPDYTHTDNNFTDGYKGVVDGIDTALAGKVDKVSGKGLSDNNFTNTQKDKLTNLADIYGVGANLTLDPETNILSANAQPITIDTEMSSSSTNAVQNRVITGALADKVDKVSGKGLSANDFTNAYKDKLDGIDQGAEVNDISTISVNGVNIPADANKNVEITISSGEVLFGTTDPSNNIGLDLDRYVKVSTTDFGRSFRIRTTDTTVNAAIAIDSIESGIVINTDDISRYQATRTYSDFTTRFTAGNWFVTITTDNVYGYKTGDVIQWGSDVTKDISLVINPPEIYAEYVKSRGIWLKLYDNDTPETNIQLIYGVSTWNEFLLAMQAGSIVSCVYPNGDGSFRIVQLTRVELDANEAPAAVEFANYRSLNSHDITDQTDQIDIYRLTNAGVWTTTTRNVASKIAAGTNMTASYANGTITLNSTGGSGGLVPHLIIISEAGEDVVKAVKGTTEIIATETSAGHYECDVPEFGTWTIHAVLNGDDAVVNLVVDTVKVYTVDDSHFHADITVTYPSGGTCSCSKSGETTLYATGSPYTFTVHSAGTWTITAEANGKTFTQTVNISESGQTVYLNVPDGATVTPTDDIATWLACGGIGNKSYTTLAEVLADTDTLSALIASSNAVDYMVRSTSWASGIALVPTMTSNTTPEGVASASNEGKPAYHAFDNDDTTMWNTNTSSASNAWVKYQFDEPTICKKAYLYLASNGLATAYKIQGSNDNSTWTDLYSGTFVVNSGVISNKVSFSNDTAYEYYRVFFPTGNISGPYSGLNTLQFYSEDGVTDSADAMTYIGLNNYASNALINDSTWLNAIANSEHIDSVLNVKRPAMTSATTPSGSITSSSTASPTQPWYAHDGNTSTRWTGISGGYAHYNRYVFPESHKFYVIKHIIDSEYSNEISYKVKYQASVDGTTWEDVSDEFTYVFSGFGHKTETVILDTAGTAYKGYGMMISNYSHGTNYNTFGTYDLQIYGREDV